MLLSADPLYMGQNGEIKKFCLPAFQFHFESITFIYLVPLKIYTLQRPSLKPMRQTFHSERLHFSTMQLWDIMQDICFTVSYGFIYVQFLIMHL